jgi:hypothetical protein
MKQQLQRLIFAAGLLFAIASTPAVACVDYHPTPYTTATVDSNLQYLEIVVHNMHLFGGTSGEFCTCAITAYNNIYDQIYYVAFLDSATGLPEPGFEPWGSNSFAAASWPTYYPSPLFDWNAYVAEVTGSGLLAGKAVNLLIRASLPPGIQLFVVDSVLYSSLLATDAYDSTNHVVAGMHNSISMLGYTGQMDIVSPQYFTGISEVAFGEYAKVFPNPASDMAAFIWPANSHARSMRLYNAFGMLIREIEITGRDFRLFRNGLPAGVYGYRVLHENGLVEQGKLMFH